MKQKKNQNSKGFGVDVDESGPRAVFFCFAIFTPFAMAFSFSNPQVKSGTVERACC